MDVTATGDHVGDEVVHLHVREVICSATRPIKELKDFRRITLEPGETQTVTFVLTPGRLSFLDVHMERIVEPGLFEVMVGPSSAQLDTIQVEVVGT